MKEAASYLGVMAIPVGFIVIVLLRYLNRRLDRVDANEVDASYPINAQWPSDTLPREFEQEPRGM